MNWWGANVSDGAFPVVRMIRAGRYDGNLSTLIWWCVKRGFRVHVMRRKPMEW